MASLFSYPHFPLGPADRVFFPQRIRLVSLEDVPRSFLHAMNCALWLAVLLAALSRSSVSNAQEPNPPRLVVPDKMPDVLSPGIRPDAIFMRNNSGEYILVPQSKYEEFEQFLRREMDEPADASLSESLDQLQITISVENQIAKLRVEASVKLSEANKRWLRIPIGMGLVQLIPSVRANESEPVFPPLRVESETGGYYWRVSPGSETQRQLDFEAVCNIVTTSQGQSLRLDLPPVPTIIKLQLPMGPWDLNVVRTGSEVVEPFRESNSLAVGVVRTLGGPISLNWHKTSIADQIQAIEVESKTTYVALNEAGLFRSASSLTIRGPKSLGGRLFLATLPKGSQWREPTASLIPFQGYRVTKSETSAPDETVLRVEFEESVSRTEAEVGIEWQSTMSVDSHSTSFAVPVIEGVQRHVGNLDLSLPRNLKLHWDPQPGIEFLKHTNDGGDSIGYSFRFLQQLNPLVARWSTGDNAARLKGTYQVVYDESSLVLTGSIDIVDDIRSFPFLQLDVPDWTVERIQVFPSGRLLDLVIDRNRESNTISTDSSKRKWTSIPLSLSDLSTPFSAPSPNPNSNPSDQNAANIEASLSNPNDLARDGARQNAPRSISFLLSRPAGNSAPSNIVEKFRFELPMLSWIDRDSQMRTSICAQGELFVQSSTSILQRSTDSPSKTILPTSDIISLSESQTTDRETSSVWRSKLKYRVLSSSDLAEWVGSAQPASVFVKAQASAVISVAGEWAELTQDWKLNAQGRIPHTLRMALPKDWGVELKQNADAMKVTIDGNAVAVSVLDTSEQTTYMNLSQEIRPRFSLVKLTLPKEVVQAIGNASERTLTIRKRWSIPQDSSYPLTFDWVLPILYPDASEDSVFTERFAGEIRFEPNARCVLKLPTEIVGRPAVANTRSPIPFDCTLQDPRLVGDMYLRREVPDASIVVETAWLQSMMNAVEQRERLVIRFNTRADSVSLILPADRIADSKVILNGRKAITVPHPSSIGRIDVSLDEATADSSIEDERTYILELFTWPNPRKQWVKSLGADLPQILNCSQHFPLIWQIITPLTDHLIGTSSSLAPGYRWRWKDLWLERHSEWTQSKLERQLGATEQPLISQQTNDYVLFAMDQRTPMRVWLAPRYLLWVPVALFLLVASFSLVEFRWIQKPWVVIVLMLVSLAFSQWAWDLSIALGQCLIASVGIALTYLALKWVLDRRSRRRSVFAARPNVLPTLGASRSGGATGSSITSAKAMGVPTVVPAEPFVESANARISNLESPSTASIGHSGEVP
ncbi:MAG: hypothetical protein ABL921_15880 [Pirellula sp.]